MPALTVMHLIQSNLLVMTLHRPALHNALGQGPADR
jgi:hypothetical protein